MKKRTLLSVIVVLALFFGLVGTSAQAKKPEGGNNAPHAQSQGKPDKPDKQADLDILPGLSVNLGITAPQAHSLAKDLGLLNYSSLPPGIAKNLARGKPLPPGIAKKYVPRDMLARLPVHPGYEWAIAGTDLLLMQAGTAVIADVLRDVFSGPGSKAD